ncbi:MAG: tRNA (adenosine(37)-N6)-threonylcarbamoyltransferase complex dimerization subunit type 1 TsaB [Myxococcota bacterium]|nr:tRNA (adenosine(37)-N6)-threonylcarbamoyltransferase complex dimerization subunit type 1 TsaB [Myxococcota bacterium]
MAVDPEAPLVLAVDTSGPVEGIALVQGELVLGSWSGRRPGRSGSGLVGRIQQVFEWGGREPGQLSGVAGVIGPGAFTGLRVGIATLRGMASALSVPSFSYRSDEAWAASFPGSTLPVAVTLDARRKEVYSALLSVGLEGRPRSIDPVRLQAPTAWFEYLAAEESCSGGVRLVGDGALLYRERACSILGERAVFTEASPAGAAVSWMARDAVVRLEAGEPGGEPLRPLYLRDHDAAIKAGVGPQSS